MNGVSMGFCESLVAYGTCVDLFWGLSWFFVAFAALLAVYALANPE